MNNKNNEFHNYYTPVILRIAVNVTTSCCSHHPTLQALNGFIMMISQTGKLLFISENASEYLGHSMEDLLIHGDSIYDIIDKQDHQTVQAELLRGQELLSPEEIGPDKPEDRSFLCRMNVSRNARRQMRFGDQKVAIGHFPW